MQLTLNNFKWFRRKNLLPKADGSRTFSAEADRIFGQNMELLQRFKGYYDSLQTMRENRDRCKRYYFGDQLKDMVPDPDGCGKITEEEYIRRQGITPMVLNVLRKTGKAIIGVYRQNKLQPMAISRDRDEQKTGEMMSIALECVYQNQNLYETNARGYEEAYISGICAFRVGYDVDDESKISDIVVTRSDINRMAWDDNTTGLYFQNISCIGYLHDMSLGKVLSTFSHSERETEQIINIYNSWARQYKPVNQQFVKDDRRKHIDFFMPLSPDTLRVIEIWTKEWTHSLYYHDKGKGTEGFVPVSERAAIEAENARRIAEVLSVGGTEDDASLIDIKYKTEEKWVVRFLTPDGYVLKQEETPYWHGSHPWVIGAYPLVDGEIHSPVEDGINPQRMIDRLLTRIEFVRMNQAKGFGIVNKKVLDDSGVTLEQFAKEYTSPSGIAALEWEGSADTVFKQFSDTTTNQGDVQMFEQYMNLLDEITGAHGAMRGEKPTSGTPAALYMQETENANNNIADFQEWYNGLILKRDYKMMMVMQQYYDHKRYLNISGKNYSKEARMYDPEQVRKTKFDLALVQSQSTGAFRTNSENLLIRLLELGAIPRDIYLEESNAPFADRVLERIKSFEEDQANAQGAQLPQGAAMPPVQQAAPAQPATTMQPIQQPEQVVQ